MELPPARLAGSRISGSDEDGVSHPSWIVDGADGRVAKGLRTIMQQAELGLVKLEPP